MWDDDQISRRALRWTVCATRPLDDFYSLDMSVLRASVPHWEWVHRGSPSRALHSFLASSQVLTPTDPTHAALLVALQPWLAGGESAHAVVVRLLREDTTECAARTRDFLAYMGDHVWVSSIRHEAQCEPFARPHSG